MKILFDMSFDGGAWPGPLANREAAVGEVWAGPSGLLNVIETALGIGRPAVASGKRAAALLPAIEATNGFWSKSFEKDPFATAETLVQWRDWLRLHGWRGEPASNRLKELAQVTGQVLPGEPDRLSAVLVALKDRRTGIERIERQSPISDLPQLWVKVFEALRMQGVEVVNRPVPPAAAHGNLAAARESGFVPHEGDHTLQLLQTNGAVEAADRVAAHLAGLDTLEGVVVVGGDSVLDAALRRYGLPTAGLPMTAGGNALLSVLPLVLACGWQPPNPQYVLELLALPKSPVDIRLRRDLIKALQSQPAVNSEDWIQALVKSLSRIKDEGGRQKAGQRVTDLFGTSTCRGTAYPVVEAQDRAALVLTWLQGNRNLKDLTVAEGPLWDAAIGQCTGFSDLLACSGLKTLTPETLRRLVAMATSGTTATTPFAAQAGLTHVRQPGGVAGPVRRVLWWNFAGTRTTGLDGVPLSLAEQEALTAYGVVLPDASTIAQAQAERWRRPLMQASETLLLVCPLRDAEGEEQFLHPLWAEIQGRLAKTGRIDTLVRQKSFLGHEAPKVARSLLTLPVAQRKWQVAPGNVRLRAEESPSGAGALIGCPLKWVLHYACGIQPATAAALPADELLYGTLVHDLISKLADETAANPSLNEPNAAKTRMAALFDELGPQVAAPLFQPGSEADRMRVRRVAIESTRAIWELLRQPGSRVVATEVEKKIPALGRILTGRPDLVADKPLRVIDMKWGGRSFRTKTLKSGAAYQLAAYSQVVREKDQPLPPTAYFILTQRRFLTVDGPAFGVAPIAGPDMLATWNAFEQAYLDRLRELQNGGVTAAAVADETGEEADGVVKQDCIDETGTLRLIAGCRYCDYRGLCGADRP